MFCTNCGAQHPDGTKFCTSCGNKLNAPAAPAAEEKIVPETVPEPVEEVVVPAAEPAAPAAGKVCATCGAELPEGRKFCTSCGAAVSAPAAPEPVVVPAAPVVEPVVIPEAPVVAPAAPIEEAAAPVEEVAAPIEEPAAPEAAQEQPASGNACPRCGSAMPEGRKFCTSCGANLNDFPANPELVTEEPQEMPTKKKKKTWKIVLIVVLALALIAGGVVGVWFFMQESAYDDAQTLIEEKNYSEAIAKLEDLDGYKDSEDLIQDLNKKQKSYDEALSLIEEQAYDEAAEELEKLGDYADAKNILAELEENMDAYDEAIKLLAENDFEAARNAFSALGDFSDSQEMADYGVDYSMAEYLLNCADYSDASGYDILGSAPPEDEDALCLGLYEAAGSLFLTLDGYEDSIARANDCYYEAAFLKIQQGDFDGALAYCDLVDQDTADAITELYESNCTDFIVWDEIMDSMDLFSEDAEDAEYAAALDAQIAALEPLREGQYADAELKTLVVNYLNSLAEEKALLDDNYSVSDWVSWYKTYASQYSILADIATTLEQDEEIIGYYTNRSNYYGAKAKIEEMLVARFNGEIKTDGEGDGRYYFDLENTSGYGFTLRYLVTWYKGEEAVYETDILDLEIPAGETVNVPTYHPGSDADNYVIQWDSETITKDGTVLPGQE